MTIQWHKRAVAQLHQVEEYVLRDFGERVRHDLLSVEMLESVSRYVKRLTRHSRYTKTSQQSSVSEMEDALQFVKSLSVTGPHQVPSNESAK